MVVPSTNLQKSSLVTISVTTLVVLGIAGIGLWYLIRVNSSSEFVLSYVLATAFGLLLIIALNLNARSRWLEALRHDAEILEDLVRPKERNDRRGNQYISHDEFRALSETMRAERRRLLHLGLTDHLCNVGNRRALEQWLQACYANPNTRAPISLLLIDIDHFKEINDRHGHKMGDRVIHQFAQLLKRRVRQGDLIARLGGDEFCVVFPNTRLTVAVSLTRRIRAQLPLDLEIGNGVSQKLSWTGGISVSDPFDSHYDQVLWRADEALIEAKAAGRNQTKICQVQGARGKSRATAEVRRTLTPDGARARLH